MRRVVIAMVGLALLSAGIAQQPPAFVVPGIPRAGSSTATCAAFSSAGERAIAWVSRGTLAVALASPSNSSAVMHLNLPSAPPPNPDRSGCKLAFSRDGSRLAAAVQEGPESAPLLRVGIIDPARRKLLYGFTVHDRDAPGPFALIGFLEGSHAVAIAAAPQNLQPSEGISHARVTTLVFGDPSSSDRAEPTVYERVITGVSSSEPPDWMDASHNRLWYLNDPQFCPMRAVSLTGPLIPGPVVGTSDAESDLCGPAVLLFPSPDELVIADVSGAERVWRVALGNAPRAVSNVRLPRIHARASASAHRWALARDGQVGAISRTVLAYGFLDIDRYLNDDIVAFQVHPLRVLAHIKAPRGHHEVRGLAVDSSQGQADILACWDGVWMRYEIPFRTVPAGNGR